MAGGGDHERFPEHAHIWRAPGVRIRRWDAAVIGIGDRLPRGSYYLFRFGGRIVHAVGGPHAVKAPAQAL